MINNVIISVYDKKGLDEFVGELYGLNPKLKIISSGGTARKIAEFGYNVTEVSDYTGFPESPGGLVKTLHPKVHAGILLDMQIPEERKYLEENGINPIDMLVCNLYPFEKTVNRKAPHEEVVEMIDIGGPTLIRSAAKGCLRRGGKPIPIVDPKDYKAITFELKKDGCLMGDRLFKLINKAFEHTRDYDTHITSYTSIRARM